MLIGCLVCFVVVVAVGTTVVVIAVGAGSNDGASSNVGGHDRGS